MRIKYNDTNSFRNRLREQNNKRENRLELEF